MISKIDHFWNYAGVVLTLSFRADIDMRRCMCKVTNVPHESHLQIVATNGQVSKNLSDLHEKIPNLSGQTSGQSYAAAVLPSRTTLSMILLSGHESLPGTKPNKKNGPWPLSSTLVKPDWRSEKSHFSWKCDAAYVYYYFWLFLLFWPYRELKLEQIKEKQCANVILDWFGLNSVAGTSIIND